MLFIYLSAYIFTSLSHSPPLPFICHLQFVILSILSLLFCISVFTFGDSHSLSFLFAKRTSKPNVNLIFWPESHWNVTNVHLIKQVSAIVHFPHDQCLNCLISFRCLIKYLVLFSARLFLPGLLLDKATTEQCHFIRLFM